VCEGVDSVRDLFSRSSSREEVGETRQVAAAAVTSRPRPCVVFGGAGSWASSGHPLGILWASAGYRLETISSGHSRCAVLAR
jgi:hypothetical protein